jgi:hypothetical protein
MDVASATNKPFENSSALKKGRELIEGQKKPF